MRLLPASTMSCRANGKLALGLIAMLFCFAIGERKLLAAPPTTAPVEPIETWFANLAHHDSAMREQARLGLMGISREQLEVLKTLVSRNQPLATSQTLALREIVEHVYLATEPYKAAPIDAGFLGVIFARGDIFLEAQGPDDPPQVGVVVTERMPGFCSYRSLQNGDTIIGLREAPNRVVRRTQDLIDLIASTRAGEVVHLQIIRGGQQMEVALTLNVRPIWAQGANDHVVRDALRERERQAEQYWEKEFAPLIENGVL